MAEEKPQSKSHQHTAAHLIAPIHPNTPKTKTAGSFCLSAVLFHSMQFGSD